MGSLFIVFPKIEDGKRIRDLLTRRGFAVNAVCATGAQLLLELEHHSAGIVICGYKLQDMYFSELRELLPAGFELLLIASARILGMIDGSGVVTVSMPLSVQELMDTVSMMQHEAARRKKRSREKPRQRTEAEKRILDDAKRLLMDRNRMTEAEAHRYLQKCSMDSGNNLIETAQMILALGEYSG